MTKDNFSKKKKNLYYLIQIIFKKSNSKVYTSEKL